MREEAMELEIDASSTDVIAMNLTIAALERWLQNVSADRRGEDLGREIGALYREIHAAVDEMSHNGTDDEDEEDEEDDEEDDGEFLQDERD
jgi:predicted  nucleic acid-binding Zn-ribbon protein